MAKFQPGKSGNPGGRSKTTITIDRDGELVEVTITELARGHTEDAMAALREIAVDKMVPPAARVSAATALLDRGWGKPAQMLVGDPEQPIAVAGVTLEQVLAARARIVDEC